LQTKHQTLEDEWNTDYQALEANVDELKKELELISSAEEERSKSISAILSDLEEYEKVQMDLTAYQDNLSLNQERVQNLTVTEQKLAHELNKVNAENSELMKEKERLDAAKEEIDKLTSMNDEAGAKELQEANQEYSSILEEMDKLARSIATLQDTNTANKRALTSGFSSDQKIAQDLEAKIIEKEKYIDSKAKDIEDIKNTISEIKESSASDIMQFDDLCAKFVDAKSAQVAIIQALSAQREKEKKEMKQTFGMRASNELLKIEAMDCAIELLMKADELESELQNIQMFA
jgi:chromosome segregation ATPase